MRRLIDLAVVLFLVIQPAATYPQTLDTPLPADFCSSEACTRAKQHEARGEFAEAALAWEKAVPSKQTPGSDVWTQRVDLLVRAARAHAQAGHYERAGMTFWKASRSADTMSDFLAFLAADNLTTAEIDDVELLGQIAKTDAFERRFPGTALVHARLLHLRDDELPPPGLAREALADSETQFEACIWLSPLLAATPKSEAKKRHHTLSELVYGSCLDRKSVV